MKILVINEYSKEYISRYPDDSCTELCEEEQLKAAEISGDTYTSLEDFQNAFNEGKVSSHDNIIIIKEKKYCLFGDEDTKMDYLNGGLDRMLRNKSSTKSIYTFLETDVEGIAGNAMAYGWYIDITEEEFNRYLKFIDNNTD